MKEYSETEDSLASLAAQVLEEKLQAHMNGHSELSSKDLLEIYKVASQQRASADFIIMVIASAANFLTTEYEPTLGKGEEFADHQRIITLFLRDFYRAAKKELVMKARSLKDGNKMTHIKD